MNSNNNLPGNKEKRKDEPSACSTGKQYAPDSSVLFQSAQEILRPCFLFNLADEWNMTACSIQPDVQVHDMTLYKGKTALQDSH